MANRYQKKNDLYDDLSIDAFPVHPASSPSPPPFITNVGDFRSQTPPSNLSFYESSAYGQQGINGSMNTNVEPHQPSGYGQPAFGQFGFENIMNNPAAGYLMGMGVSHVQGAIGDGMGKYKSYFEGLKLYFNVDNRYVIQKLRHILFPFTNKSWERKGYNMNQSQENAPRDTNEPDLYIPLMAFMTYILLTCFVMGIEKRFTPDLLATTASTSIFINVLEIGLVKLGFYILAVPTNIPFLDMCAYSGYKYVGIVLSIISGNLLGNAGYYPVLFFTSIATSYFMLKTLRRAGVQTEDHSMRVRFDHNTAKRNYFVVFVALLQPLFFFFLTYSYSQQLIFSSLFATAATAAKAVAPIQPDEPHLGAPARHREEPKQPDQPAQAVDASQAEPVDADQVPIPNTQRGLKRPFKKPIVTKT